MFVRSCSSCRIETNPLHHSDLSSDSVPFDINALTQQLNHQSQLCRNEQPSGTSGHTQSSSELHAVFHVHDHVAVRKPI